MAASTGAKAAALAAAVVVLAGCSGSSDSPEPSETYGPDSPMPLDVAAQVLIEACVTEQEGDAPADASYLSVEECIESSGFVLALLLDDNDTAVVDEQGDPIPSDDIDAAVEERALEMWQEQG